MHIAIGQGEIHKRVSGHWVRAGPKDSSIYTCKQAILVLNFKTHTLENNWTGDVYRHQRLCLLRVIRRSLRAVICQVMSELKTLNGLVREILLFEFLMVDIGSIFLGCTEIVNWVPLFAFITGVRNVNQLNRWLGPFWQYEQSSILRRPLN